ncbi:MAG: uroporphyrinogen decarboxylase [Cellvibrionaceae bacterium]|jgi:uroporphyrinogen decarboxylase
MNSRERVFATLDRKPVDRTPIDCWLYQKQFVERLEADYGSRGKFLDEFNIDIYVGFVPYPNQFGRKFDVSELKDVDLGDPKHEKWLSHTDWNYDFAGQNVRTAVTEHKDKRAIIAHTWGIIEGTSQLIGIENCWMNLAGEPKKMAAWFDRYADWLCGLMDSLKAAGVDIVTLSDDWGSNGTMLFSPRMWRKLVKPYAMRVTQYAKSIGLYVNLHSDGYIVQILDDLVEIGYHSWHPLQESAGMDPQAIKDAHGDKFVCYGSLDVIDGLFAYDGDELAEYITKRFEIYAPGGGFIFNTGHFVQKDIPPARLIRAYTLVNELALKYGTLKSE